MERSRYAEIDAKEYPLHDPEAFRGILQDCARAGINKPLIIQDGGHEIHPVLNGITFNFWFPPEGSKFYQKCAVNHTGSASDPLGTDIATHLTGLAFEGFGSAKAFLRKFTANKIAEATQKTVTATRSRTAQETRKTVN